MIKAGSHKLKVWYQIRDENFELSKYPFFISRDGYEQDWRSYCRGLNLFDEAHLEGELSSTMRDEMAHSNGVEIRQTHALETSAGSSLNTKKSWGFLQRGISKKGT